eukprot:2742803-Amphidinium_carterae.1
MAWYRYGSILLPAHISIDEMRRECAFYQLPDDVKVLRERWTVRDASMAAAHQKERILEAAARLKAECLIAGLLQDPCLYQLTALTEEWVAAEMNEDRDDIMEYLVECDEHLDAAVKTVAAREGLDAFSEAMARAMMAATMTPKGKERQGIDPVVRPDAPSWDRMPRLAAHCGP